MPTDAWKSIDEHQLRRLDELFAAEPDRLARLTVALAGIYFDWSKTHLDQDLIGQFESLAQQQGLASARDALFAGGIVNPTEQRSADHLAERGSGNPEAVQLATTRRSQS